jgi:hypothetical protein
MGRIWDDLIVSVTTQELIDQGHLSDFRVFAPSHPDLTGVKTVMGDYEAKGLGHAMDKPDLIADIVTTWKQRAEGLPTLCFAVNRVHAKHIQKQFDEAGVRTGYVDAYSTREERGEVARQFENGDITVVCNVGVLTTGVDWDVRCVILARPTRSEILYVQIIGRGLRTAPGKTDCLLRGTKVLTDRGEVSIEDVTLDHKLWDGVEWVSHAGSVCRGVKPVMQYAGLTATPDHRVMTNAGWKTIEEAARGRLGVAITGFGQQEVRFSPNCFENYVRVCTSFACRGHMREVPSISYGSFSQYSETAQNSSLSALQWQEACQCAEMVISKVSSAAEQVSKSALCVLRKVWCAWNPIQIQLFKRGGPMGLGEFGGSGSLYAVGPNRQQWALRAGEYSLDRCRCEYEQYSQKQRGKAEVCFFSKGIPSSDVRGFHFKQAYFCGHDGPADCGSLGNAFVQTEGEVWDILNSGPLQRFTANGRLVHNCIILDHSDTTLRLGLVTDIKHDSLDDGRIKAANEARKERLPKECPKCAFVKPAKVHVCPSCGFKPEAVNKIETGSGELLEIVRGGKKPKPTMLDKIGFYSQLLRYSRDKGYSDGWAYYSYKDKFGVGPSVKPMPALYVEPSTESWIRHRNIRRAKMLEKTGR